MAIPNVTNKQILTALEYIDREGIPSENKSSEYHLVTEKGTIYPPKYVIAVAHHIATGEAIRTTGYNSVEAVKFLKKRGFEIATKKDEYSLIITADSMRSTDPLFDMNNLGLGDRYKPLDVRFVRENGEIVSRERKKNENKISNRTLPYLAFQVFEDEIAMLSDGEKKNFPVCRYTTDSSWIRGIFASVAEFKAYKNTEEKLEYTANSGEPFIIYCWNIFSTLYFVQECLKRFGRAGEYFELLYCRKDEELAEQRENQENNMEDMIVQRSNIARNTILYGPPGTGKTYHTAIYAYAICHGLPLETVKAMDYQTVVLPGYQELLEEDRIIFTTFHQSYGYEEFVEGVRPIVEKQDGKKDIYYDVVDGVFKVACQKCSEECGFEEAWQAFIDDVKKNQNRVLIERDTCQKLLQWNEKTQKLYDQSTESMKYQYADRDTVKALYDGTYVEKNGGSAEHTHLNSLAVLKKLIRDYRLSVPRVFIIDEINRGNISKIFGELITLIEDDKRETAHVSLPYSSASFTVPKNLYIIGTMNTADRSIALMDTALRRRFSFVEMPPKAELFAEKTVEGVSLELLLKELNERIEYLYDREHTIGHGYFKAFLTEDGDIEALREVFQDRIVPLLQEYFYDDYEKIAIVLGDDRSSMQEDELFVSVKHVPKKIAGTPYDEGDKFSMNVEVFSLDADRFAKRLQRIYTLKSKASDEE